MKKNYIKPTVQVVKVQQQNLLMNLSLQNNAGLTIEGPGIHEDRSRSIEDWDDE